MAMTYTRKALATRQRIIDTASRLFFSKGFNRTKLDEILMLAKVRKGNFYYYFSSKDDLGLAVIRETGRTVVVEWIRSLIDPIADPLGSLRELPGRIAGSEGVLEGNGNPLSNLALEMADLSEDFRKAIASIMSEVVSIFTELYERIGKTHRLREEPRQLAAFVVSSIEGAMLMYKLNRASPALHFTIDHALSCTIPPNATQGAT